MHWHWSSSEKSSSSKPAASVFSPPPIIFFSYGAQICPPLVQIIGHVSAVRGYLLSTYAIKTLNLDPPSPCTHLYAFKYLLPFVRTYFQYGILPPIKWERTIFIFYNGMSSLAHLTSFSKKIEIKIKGRMWCQLFCLVPRAVL